MSKIRGPKASGWALNELLASAERDLSEAETIADRGSMLVWQSEAALERTRLYLTLVHVDAPVRDANPVSERPDYIELAQQKLNEARQLIHQTEKPYVPHVPDWAEWEPPEYVGVFQEGEIVGYHCRNEEIAALQQVVD